MDTIRRVEESFAQLNYAMYKFKPTDTFESVGNIYGVSPQTLARMNNITGNLPKYIKDAPTLRGKTYIQVPLVGNGGEMSTPMYYYYEVLNSSGFNEYTISSSKLTGTGGNVNITINGVSYDIPCYPKSVSDSYNINHSSESLFTSTEPYVVYNNSGPRQVSVSFTFHREMRGIDNDKYMDELVRAIQAACYPVDDGTTTVETILTIGNDIYIRGIITGGVPVNYSGPIIDGKYNVVDISFTVQEIYGNNISYNSKKNMGGWVKP